MRVRIPPRGQMKDGRKNEQGRHVKWRPAGWEEADERISLRMTKSELKMLHDYANAAGCKSLNEALRKLIRATTVRSE